jgi:hypothetical protein
MLLVAVIAGELALFQEAWEAVLLPPVTMAFLAMNLGLFFLLIRPRALETKIIGMMSAGLAAVFGMAAYMALSEVQNHGGLGLFGRLIETGFFDLCKSLIFQNGRGWAAQTACALSDRAAPIEVALLDAMGVGLFWYGGRLDSRLRARWRHWRAPRPASIDDPAVTPL